MGEQDQGSEEELAALDDQATVYRVWSAQLEASISFRREP